MNEKKNVLKEKSFAFAARSYRLYKYLADSKHEYVLSKQLLRSGTSIGANVREANNAASKNDFIHKLNIAQKEADESIYWLELLREVDLLTQVEFKSIEDEANQLLKMIRSSILTTRRNMKDSQ